MPSATWTTFSGWPLPTFQEAEKAYLDILTTADELGLKLSPAKCTLLTHSLDWLGYSICAKEITIKIPTKKLNEIIHECEAWKEGEKALRRDLQCLVGQYVAKCVRPARCFMNRILTALRAAPYTGKHNITQEMIKDVQWFSRYARSTNRMVLLRAPAKPEWLTEYDSSLLVGGAYSNTSYFSEIYTKVPCMQTSYQQFRGDQLGCGLTCPRTR